MNYQCFVVTEHESIYLEDGYEVTGVFFSKLESQSALTGKGYRKENYQITDDEELWKHSETEVPARITERRVH